MPNFPPQATPEDVKKAAQDIKKELKRIDLIAIAIASAALIISIIGLISKIC